MANTIKLSQSQEIDLAKLIDSRLLVQANSGGGKSWLLRRLLEQSHGKVQQIVLDLEGEFGTLREKYDYILAGKGGDTPADPRSAALLARKLLEMNVSAIIDLYELAHHERRRFVRLFLESMVNAPKELWHPVMVVIDEAHVFVPQTGESEAANAVIDLATRGRKRGYCAVLATQRISKLHKDAAAECNNKLIGRTGLDVDMKRAGDELGFTTNEQRLSLRSLEAGEFYAFGPAISTEVRKVKVGPVQTTHPKAGARSLTHVTPPTDRIKKLLGKLADLPQEAAQEARTVAELKQENATLKREKSILERKGGADPQAVQKAVDAALAQKEREFAAERKSLQRAAEERGKRLAQIAKIAGVEADAQTLTVTTPRIELPKTKVVIRPVPASTVPVDGLTGPEQRILDAVAWLESIGVPEPEQTAVAFLAGYTVGGGGFNNPKGSLRTKGLIEYRGGNLALTDAGRELARVPETPLTTEELHGKVLSVLPGPEQRLLRPLLEVYPDDLSNEELAEASGYTAGAGGFNNPKGRLRTLGLVDYPSSGRVRARDILFLNS